MVRFGYLLTIVAASIVGLGAAASTLGTAARSIPLSSGKELRVLKVSFGTNHFFSAEPFWKQPLRRLLPARWQNRIGPFQGERFSTRYASLVVWLGEFAPNGAAVGYVSVSEPSAVFPDGSVAKGRLTRKPYNTACFEFSSFARDARQVHLRFRAGTNLIAVAIRNPQPSTATNWRSQPLPQTNHSFQTQIIARAPKGVAGLTFAGDTFPVFFRARSQAGEPVGWMQWRVTAFDPLGNWTETESWSADNPRRVPLLPASSSVWKLLVDAKEYISMGFVPPPTNGTCITLPLNSRARILGVKSVAFLGPGIYRADHAGRQVRFSDAPGGPPGVPSITVPKRGGAAMGDLEISSGMPGILCVHDLDVPIQVRARLRERLDANRGTIFANSSTVSLTNSTNGSKVIATFSAVRLPNVFANLEVEIVATLPPAEFFVAAPRPE